MGGTVATYNKQSLGLILVGPETELVSSLWTETLLWKLTELRNTGLLLEDAVTHWGFQGEAKPDKGMRSRPRSSESGPVQEASRALMKKNLMASKDELQQIRLEHYSHRCQESTRYLRLLPFPDLCCLIPASSIAKAYLRLYLSPR